MHIKAVFHQFVRAVMAVYFIAAAMLACLQYFALTLAAAPDLQPVHTDGLVVATGGQQRISDGLRLVRDGVSDRMLITGVGTGITKDSLAEIFAHTQEEEQILSCCVELDRTAMDTKGNALAARRWAEAHQLASLSLVTANYHMPRALLLFRRIMPGRTIHGLPVIPRDLQPARWYADWPTAKLLAKEYAKYMFAILSTNIMSD